MMLHQLKSLSSGILICVTLWSYPLGTLPYGDNPKGITLTLQLSVCEEKGQRFFEAKRVTLVSYITVNGLIEEKSSITEIKLPWSYDEENVK